ncbi:hypothetical protein MVES_003329 [Malassezia vespertilionis]|uniref:DUF218 domain-containing protein n=2 Tax=Malassezia vespertilionis TaxID=2020962 RepID=A0A2N1J8N3_9BASI|nr:hypothetical protein MVES_003329 [Malassezia vespertilionis]
MLLVRWAAIVFICIANVWVRSYHWDNDHVLPSTNSSVPHVETRLLSRLYPEWHTFWKKCGEQWPVAARDAIDKVVSLRTKRLEDASYCILMPRCIVDAMKLSQAEKQLLHQALVAASSPQSLLRMWPRYVKAMNYILDVYGNGVHPKEAEDAMMYDPTRTEYLTYVGSLAAHVNGSNAPWDVMRFGVNLLDANMRDNAAQYFDIWEKENRRALERATMLDWDKYEYGCVVVPGMGTIHLDEKLSPMSKLRLRYAITAFHSGQAPFLVVSGGAVHPKLTRNTEAYEMRAWLLEEHGIPEEYIVMEPYARHTTTNLRNAGRVMNVLGQPHKKMLIVTDEMQLSYIMFGVGDAGERDLGYSLGTIGPREGAHGVQFTPSAFVEMVDPTDPLDP